MHFDKPLHRVVGFAAGREDIFMRRVDSSDDSRTGFDENPKGPLGRAGQVGSDQNKQSLRVNNVPR